MSLRRPFRESWEQRDYKKPARSLSPSAKKPSWTPIRNLSPSPERRSVTFAPITQDSYQLKAYIGPTVEDDTDTDDYYPERLALTPEPEEGRDDTSNDEGSTTPVDLFGQPPQPRQSTLANESGSQHLDVASHAATIGAVSPRSSDTPTPPTRPESDSTTIYPEDSASNTPSATGGDDSAISSIPSPDLRLPTSSSTIDIGTERNLLSSSTFPVHLLRPVPDLPTLLTQIAPVLGDPGTISGPVHFGTPPQIPQPTIFDQWTLASRQKWIGPYDPLKNSVLKEKPVDANKQNHLQWEREIRAEAFDLDSFSTTGSSNRSRSRSRPSTRSSSGTAPGSSVDSATTTTTATAKQPWKTRQYSTDPHLRTRHLAIDLLQRKISHGELLSLKLSIDARRDAIAIGGAAGDIGGSLGAGPGGGSGSGSGNGGRAGAGPAPGDGAGTSVRGSGVSNSTVHTSSSRRTRDSARNASMSVASGSSGHTRGTSATRRARASGYDEYDQQQRRYRSGDISASFETGRYGSGGLMLWRLVRVGAVVDGLEHVAWWCVPERSLGGFF